MDIDIAVGTIELKRKTTQFQQEIAALQVIITHKKSEVEAKHKAIQQSRKRTLRSHP